MIYDHRGRALELRQRILKSMTAEEIEEYARLHSPAELGALVQRPRANGTLTART